MEKKLVLVGKSCTGKSTLAKKLEKLNLTSQLSTTSRPLRINERHGVDYNFISEEKFKQMIENNEFVEFDIFNKWYYGLTNDDYAKADILILSPRGVQKCIDRFGKEAFIIIFLESSIDIRRKRTLKRGDLQDELQRRWVADDLDFENLEQFGNFWDLKISIQNENAFDILEKFIK